MREGVAVKAVRIAAAASYVLMIVVNVLANILPINGVTTGQVSDCYPNLFAPAGLSFAIWGLIYLLLAGFTMYQLGFFQDKRGAMKPHLLYQVAVLFTFSSLANTAWIFCWHYKLIPLSMVLMVLILLSLISIIGLVDKKPLSLRENVFVRLPFSVYLGWITVATIANATVLLVSWEWDGFGLSEPTWTVIMIIAGMLIGGATTLRNRDAIYGLVVVWAYLGIIIRHTSPQGFGGQFPLVVAVTILCIVVLAAAIIATIFRKSRSTRIKV